MGIKLIAIDFDGTLCALKETHFEALNMALYEIAGSRSIITPEEHGTDFDGLPTAVKLSILNKLGRLNPKYNDAIKKSKQEYTLKAMEKCITPDYILIETLKRLSEKYKLSVVSNALHETVKRGLELLQIIRYFDYYIGNDDVMNPKPHPEPYLKAMARFNVGPRETLVLEDNKNGLQSGFRAGCCLCEIRRPSNLTLERIETFCDIYS